MGRCDGIPIKLSRYAVHAACLFDVPRCRPFLTCGDPFQALECVRILANQENESRRLGIRLGAALFPLLEGAFVNPQLASENGS